MSWGELSCVQFHMKKEDRQCIPTLVSCCTDCIGFIPVCVACNGGDIINPTVPQFVLKECKPGTFSMCKYNKDGKLKIERRDCGFCGGYHGSEWCPPTLFSVVTCKECKNELIMPADAGFKFDGIFCGKCDKKGYYNVRIATIFDMKKHNDKWGL